MPAKMTRQQSAFDVGRPAGGIIDQNRERLPLVEGFLGAETLRHPGYAQADDEQETVAMN